MKHSQNPQMQKGSLIVYAIVALLFGLLPFFSGLNIVLTSLSTELTTLECERIELAQVTCKLTSSSFLHNNVTSIRQLHGAELQRMSQRERILLVTENEKIPLTKGYVRTGYRPKVDQINTFINNSVKPSLEIQVDKRHWFGDLSFFLFGSICMLIGGSIFILFALYKPLTSWRSQ